MSFFPGEDPRTKPAAFYWTGGKHSIAEESKIQVKSPFLLSFFLKFSICGLLCDGGTLTQVHFLERTIKTKTKTKSKTKAKTKQPRELC